MIYSVKNWRKFQHYRDRNPPWIKLHFELLSSSDWVMLADASRVLAIACMLVASRNDGQIDGSEAGLDYLQRVAYLSKKPDLTPLIKCGFLERASGCKQMLADARPETETETETENIRASRSPDGVKILVGLGVAEQTARDWLAVRKAKRAPLTQTVIDSLITEAGKANIPVSRAVEICAERSWQGFKAAWLEQQNAGHEKKVGNGSWRTSEAGIQAKGKEIGLQPRAGENWQQYATRIQERIDHARQ